jgi:23S rRNA (pseudouridine1915-N3)-methyltransferase
MKIQLIQTGKSHFNFVNEGFDEYFKRLKFYTSFTYQEIQISNKEKSSQPELIMKAEAALQMKQIKAGDFLVLLDEGGKEFDSISFSKYIEKLSIQTNQLTFLIGGAYGFDQSIYERANAKISLSKMTFSHQLVKLIFAEQLYRAYTIIKGEPYHHA